LQGNCTKYDIDNKRLRIEQLRTDSIAQRNYELSSFDNRIARQSIPIPMFHIIGQKTGSSRDRYIVTPYEFSDMLEYFHNTGYSPVSAQEFVKGDFPG